MIIDLDKAKTYIKKMKHLKTSEHERLTKLIDEVESLGKSIGILEERPDDSANCSYKASNMCNQQ